MKRSVLLLATLYLLSVSTSEAAVTCHQTLSPGQSIASAFNAAPDGSRICLKRGIYTESPNLSNGGEAGVYKTLRSVPGQVAVIQGRTRIPDGSNFVIVSDLVLDGFNQELPNPQVNGDDVWLLRNEITNRHNGICLSLSSSPQYGRAERIVVRRNYFHACGDLPQANHHHCIYSSAYDVTIEYNLITDCADRGIQFYSSGQRQLARFNIICDNGQGGNFSGSGTRDTTATQNVICSSDGHQGPSLAGGWNWYSWETSSSANNSLTYNCLYADNPESRYNENGGVDSGDFTEVGNIITDSRPVDSAWHVTDPDCQALVGDPIQVIGRHPFGPPGL